MRSLILAATVFLAATPATLACGVGLMAAIYVAKFPEIASVKTAETAARDSGRLVAGEEPQTSLAELHRWRREHMAETLSRFSDLLADSRPAAASHSAYLLLVNELQWVELASDAGGTTLKQQPYAPPQGTPLVFTSRVVIDNLLQRTLTLEEAVGRQLVVVRAGAASRTLISGLLAATFRASSAVLEEALIPPPALSVQLTPTSD